MPRAPRYVFGRFNLIANFSEKGVYVWDGLSASEQLRKKDFIWRLCDTNKFETELGLFYHGFLVKYKDAIDEEVVDVSTNTITDESVLNRIVAKSRYMLHVKSGLIAYHPVPVQIPPHLFRERFSELFELSHDKLFVDAEIQSVQEESRTFEAIRKLQKITRFKVYLHPSNPSNRDVWKSVDDRLHRLEAVKYKEEIVAKADSNGLKLLEDDDVVSKIQMAYDGYGEAEVKGEVNGEQKTITTKDNPIGTAGLNDDQPIESLFEVLKLGFNRILGRFTGAQ